MIYVVTSGSYSDYGILAVYTNKKAAESFVKAYNDGEPYDHAIIEEYEEGPTDDLFKWRVDMRVGSSIAVFKTPTVTFCCAGNDLINNVTEMKSFEYKDLEASTTPQRYPVVTYSVHVKAESKEAALKAGVEMIQRYRATTPGAL